MLYSRLCKGLNLQRSRRAALVSIVDSILLQSSLAKMASYCHAIHSHYNADTVLINAAYYRKSSDWVFATLENW